MLYLLKDINVDTQLSYISDKYVAFPADKSPNNIGCVCGNSTKINWLVTELTTDLEYQHVYPSY